ncbi:MAG: helix-turn-helix transcriptional regulator [Cyanobacteriota/Melainabacteria group bacterium]
MGPEKRATRNLAKHLRRYRLEKGWSQDELAYQTGSDRTYISDIERGLRNPSLKTLARLASALDVTIGDLCDPD